MKRAWLVSMVLLSTAAGSARGDPATTVSVPGASRARVACVDLQKAATLTKGWPALAERAAALKSSPDAAAALLQPLNTKLMAALEKVRVAGGFSLILREGADPFCATDLTKVVAQVVDGGEPVVEGRVAAERLACATAEVVVAAGGGTDHNRLPDAAAKAGYAAVLAREECPGTCASLFALGGVPAPVIDASLGCVDLDRAMATSPETARAKAKLEADFKAAQAKVDRLTADFQQWKANHPHAPDLEDKEDELEYAVNGLQGEIETEGRNLEKGVKDHLRGIVAKLQKDRKLDYVVETTMVASCPVALDLTDALVAADR